MPRAPNGGKRAKKPAAPFVSRRRDPRTHDLWGTLDAAQRDACMFVHEGAGSMFLCGAAGTGKSRVISVVAGTADAAVTATTACAASLIAGVTLHSLLRWIPGEPFAEWCKYVRLVRRRLAYVHVLVVDEASMLARPDFETLDRMLRKVAAGIAARKDTCDAPFGGFRLLLVGDVLQLPPVGGAPFYTAPLFAQLAPRVLVLGRIFRQTAPLFLHLLAALRLGRPTPLAVLTVLALEWTAANLVAQTNAMHLYAVRVLRDAHNLHQLRLFGPCTRFERSWELGIDGPGAYTIGGKRVDVVAEVARESHPPPAIPALFALGCPVRVVANVDPRGGLVNGALGFVEGIDAAARTVTVRLADGRRHVVAERPVYTRVWKLANGRKLVDRCICLPLELAFAATVHAAQGATVAGPLVLDTTHPYVNAALLYVGASRATRLAHLLPYGVASAMARVRPAPGALDFLAAHGLDCAAEHAALDAESAALLPAAADAFAAEADLSPDDARRALRGVLANPRLPAAWPKMNPAWDAVRAALA